METGDTPDWSMLVVATEAITALDLHGHIAILCPRSVDTLAEIGFQGQHRHWRFLVGRCGWSTYLLRPEREDPCVYVAVPGHVDALDVNTAPSVVAHEIIRQLVDDTPLAGSPPARIDRPRRLSVVLHPETAAVRHRRGANAHPAGRRLRSVDTAAGGRVVHIDWGDHGD